MHTYFAPACDGASPSSFTVILSNAKELFRSHAKTHSRLFKALRILKILRKLRMTGCEKRECVFACVQIEDVAIP